MSNEQPVPIPAATLVVFRRAPDEGPAQLLMVIRSKALAFAGGMAVFPGGRVDEEDHALAARLVPDGDHDEIAHRIAAIRETLEETGLAVGFRRGCDAATAARTRETLLSSGSLEEAMARNGLELDPASLTPFARWLPLGLAHGRIFDTRFYLADLGTGNVEITVDETENTRLFWITAEDALAKADRGELSLIFPTRRNLERLAQFADFASARSHAEATPQRIITPQIVRTEEGQALTIPDDLGYPVTREKLSSAMRS